MSRNTEGVVQMTHKKIEKRKGASANNVFLPILAKAQTQGSTRQKPQEYNRYQQY